MIRPSRIRTVATHFALSLSWLAILLTVCFTVNPRTAPKGAGVAVMAMALLSVAHVLAGARADLGVD